MHSYSTPHLVSQVTFGNIMSRYSESDPSPPLDTFSLVEVCLIEYLSRVLCPTHKDEQWLYYPKRLISIKKSPHLFFGISRLEYVLCF